MNAPIIFFHKGFDPYIAITLWQARRTNPDTPIYLLGDATNDLSSLGIIHVNYQEHMGRRDEFVSVYQHFSPHELECERLCIERWFFLEAFLRERGIERCVYLDSDLLLLMNLGSLAPAWDGFDVAGAPLFFGICYFSKPQIIKEFCDYILAVYRDAGQIEKWRVWFEDIQKQGWEEGVAGVSDMTLSRMFIERSQLKCFDLRRSFDNTVFDISFCGITGPGDLSGKLAWNKTGHYYEGTSGGVKSRLACLHCWGTSKRYSSAFTGWDFPLVRSFFKPNYRRNFKKLLQHAYYGWRFRRALRSAS
ncbi:MAG: hypothetical protein JWR69_878 [Pedosphaera sp.]|nr:hypothetical protein [Pedosphaera sp.]